MTKINILLDIVLEEYLLKTQIHSYINTTDSYFIFYFQNLNKVVIKI